MTSEYTVHDGKLTGKLHWVQLDTGADDNDHYLDPEERFRVAMARQESQDRSADGDCWANAFVIAW